MKGNEDGDTTTTQVSGIMRTSIQLRLDSIDYFIGACGGYRVCNIASCGQVVEY